MQISFFYRVAYSFLIIILIPLALMGVGMFVVVSSTMNDTILEKNQDLVNSVSYKLQLILANTEDSLRNTARLIEMGRLDTADLQIYLEELERETSIIDMIQIVNNEGQVSQVIPSDDSLLGIDLSGHSFLKEAREKEGLLWSQSFLSVESGEPTVTVSAVFGTFSIVFYLNLKFLGESLFSEREKEQGILYILDKDGTYIAHPDNLLVSRRENLRHIPIIRSVIDHRSGRDISEITRDEILTLKMIEPTGWILVYEQSVTEAFSQILFYRNIMILGSLLTFVLAAMILSFVIRDSIIPLKLLIEATRQVSSGSYEINIKRTKVREINELAEHFNSMVTSVRDREEELLKLRNYLSSIIDSMPSVLICVDEDAKVVLWNRLAIEITGLAYEDALGKLLEEVYPRLMQSEQTIRECLLNKRANVQKACPRESSDGETAYEDITVYPLVTGGLEGAVIRIDDVSERVQMEKVLLQTEKLSSLGGLAAGMAHDLNNLLTPILGYSDMLSLQYGDVDGITAYSKPIYEAGVRSKNLIRQLLAFSRKQNLEYKLISLKKAVKGFAMLLRRTIREDIQIELDLDSGDGFVLADSGQMEQVLMNLCVNAQDAMPEGGVLRIQTGVAAFDEDDLSRLGAAPGVYHSLTVRDTGTGMDEATRKHIFEPFYSTKGEYGNGLGLATVYGIVKQHNGYISVDSREGEGSSFTIYLKAAEKSTPLKELPLSSATNREGRESILITEDNEQVRTLARTILENFGYTVATAENGESALKLLRDKTIKIDLLLTDLVMPGINGKELFLRAKKMRSQLKVLYMSGYTNNILNNQEDLDQGSCFIQKPFSLTTLTEKVRDALDRVSS